MGHSYVNITIDIIDTIKESGDCNYYVYEVLFCDTICICGHETDDCYDNKTIEIVTDEISQSSHQKLESFFEYIDINKIKQKYGKDAELRISVYKD